MKSLVLFTIILGVCCSLTAAIMFNLEPNTQKCLRDEMQAHQLVLGEYEVSDAPGQKIDYVVRGPINLCRFVDNLTRLYFAFSFLD